jgi:uncharacterized protein YbjT (DUF2867 family)
MTNPLILVTGATGTVGAEVVKQLIDNRQQVRVLVRDPAKARRFGGSVEVTHADLSTPDTLIPVFAGVEKAFVGVSVGPELARLENNGFAAAKAAGVKHVVKLSGRDLNADFMAGAKLAQMHTESEQRLRASGMAWTVLRSGWFASNILMWRVMEQGGLFLPAGDGKDVPIDPRDIAAVAVKALTRPGHEGKTYEITGPEFLTYAEMIRKVAIATGKPVAYMDTPEATVREGMLAAGINPEMVNSFLQYFSGVKAGKIHPPTTGVDEVLGRPPRTFDEWLRDHKEALSPVP